MNSNYREKNIKKPPFCCFQRRSCVSDWNEIWTGAFRQLSHASKHYTHWRSSLLSSFQRRFNSIFRLFIVDTLKANNRKQLQQRWWRWWWWWCDDNNITFKGFLVANNRSYIRNTGYSCTTTTRSTESACEGALHRLKLRLAEQPVSCITVVTLVASRNKMFKFW
jgi:hypothetical protein